jgi:DNA-binding XRE family transcriptional regulator
MNAKAQIIEENGKPQYAVVPYREYVRLLAAAAEADDVRDIEAFERRLAAGEEELVPAPIAHRLAEGENPMRVWREHRGLTQAQLATEAGLTQSYIAMLEGGERKGGVAKLRAIAAALRVDLDDLT